VRMRAAALLLAWGLLLAAGCASGRAAGGDAPDATRAAVDAMWDDLGEPATARPQCVVYPVTVGPPPVLRGNVSSHACVENAVRAARRGERELALGWLKAGACGNDKARDEIERHGNAAVDYATRAYGKSVPGG
jgi:hypothetical protein